jgi:nitronate monooxygenase
MNALIEQSSKAYRKRMEEWIDVALEEGVRFFVTSLGNPRWVVDRVRPSRRRRLPRRHRAALGREGAGRRRRRPDRGQRPCRWSCRTAQRRALFAELADLGVPLVCAGGVGTAEDFVAALDLGYAGVQVGTRFIATEECRASTPYKQAIVEADEDDVVLTERITGVPVSVIRTPYIERLGTKAGPFARWMLRGRRRKHWMRTLYALKSLWQLKRASLDESGSKDYWQAGKSVAGVDEVLPAGEVVRRFAAALAARGARG